MPPGTLTVLDFSTNEEFTKFLNSTFEYALVLIIKPTRVTKNTSTVWVPNRRDAPNKRGWGQGGGVGISGGISIK